MRFHEKHSSFFLRSSQPRLRPHPHHRPRVAQPQRLHPSLRLHGAGGPHRLDTLLPDPHQDHDRLPPVLTRQQVHCLLAFVRLHKPCMNASPKSGETPPQNRCSGSSSRRQLLQEATEATERTHSIISATWLTRCVFSVGRTAARPDKPPNNQLTKLQLYLDRDFIVSLREVLTDWCSGCRGKAPAPSVLRRLRELRQCPIGQCRLQRMCKNGCPS